VAHRYNGRGRGQDFRLQPTEPVQAGGIPRRRSLLRDHRWKGFAEHRGRAASASARPTLRRGGSAIRLEVVSATLTSADSLGLREYEYLADASDQVVDGKVARLDQTHPSPEFRMYASWLFSRSDEYRRLTGRGTGDMTLREVDDCLERLIVTPELENALAAVAAPRVAPDARVARRRPRPSRQDDTKERSESVCSLHE
jgi:hypothetical protein